MIGICEKQSEMASRGVQGFEAIAGEAWEDCSSLVQHGVVLQKVFIIMPCRVSIYVDSLYSRSSPFSSCIQITARTPTMHRLSRRSNFV